MVNKDTNYIINKIDGFIIVHSTIIDDSCVVEKKKKKNLTINIGVSRKLIKNKN